MYGWMDENVWIDWMDGWVDGCMGCVDVDMYTHVCNDIPMYALMHICMYLVLYRTGHGICISI